MLVDTWAIFQKKSGLEVGVVVEDHLNRPDYDARSTKTTGSQQTLKQQLQNNPISPEEVLRVQREAEERQRLINIEKDKQAAEGLETQQAPDSEQAEQPQSPIGGQAELGSAAVDTGHKAVSPDGPVKGGGDTNSSRSSPAARDTGAGSVS